MTDVWIAIGLGLAYFALLMFVRWIGPREVHIYHQPVGPEPPAKPKDEAE